MKLSTKFQDVTSVKSDILVFGLFENNKKLNALQEKVDKKTGGLISDFLLKKEGFEAKFGENYLLQTYGKLGADKILFMGLGKKEEFNMDKLREISAKAYRACTHIAKNKKIAMEVFGGDSYDASIAVSEGLCIAAYNFDKYKSKKQPAKIASVELLPGSLAAEKDCSRAIEMTGIVCGAMAYTKNLVNEPAEHATPTKIAEMAQEIGVEFPHVEVKVYDKKELEKMGFGAFLAVAKGSAQEPKFIHIKYAPKNARKKIALIGKGITFDSGGLNIKPAASMMNMKTDMSGCASVLGVIRAVAQLKSDVELHILSAVCENMPGCEAYKLGDILVAKNGKTIELDNTDAEGRLTLADVLCYADELGVDEIIDIATLTGACIVALGNNITGIMGKNDKMIAKFIEAGKKSGEMLWQLPMTEDMQENLKSDIADMRNTGSRGAGSSVAGVFLGNFVKNKNWIHLDIAGTAFRDKPFMELSKGPSGAMVRTLIRYITG